MDKVELAMSLIAGAGDARYHAMEAINIAKEGNFAGAREELDLARESMVEVHDIQTNLIREEMSGKSEEVSLLMVHAQDHLTQAMMFRELAGHFIDLYETIYKR
jgi:PTS system cellobiose-specific IIA component